MTKTTNVTRRKSPDGHDIDCRCLNLLSLFHEQVNPSLHRCNPFPCCRVDLIATLFISPTKACDAATPGSSWSLKKQTFSVMLVSPLSNHKSCRMSCKTLRGVLQRGTLYMQKSCTHFWHTYNQTPHCSLLSHRAASSHGEHGEPFCRTSKTTIIWSTPEHTEHTQYCLDTFFLILAFPTESRNRKRENKYALSAIRINKRRQHCQIL